MSDVIDGRALFSLVITKFCVRKEHSESFSQVICPGFDSVTFGLLCKLQLEKISTIEAAYCDHFGPDQK